LACPKPVVREGGAASPPLSLVRRYPHLSLRCETAAPRRYAPWVIPLRHPALQRPSHPPYGSEQMTVTDGNQAKDF